MAFQSVPETCELSLHFTAAGSPMVNTFYYQRSGGYTNTQLNEICAAVDIAMPALFFPPLPAEVSYDYTQVRGLENIVDYVFTHNEHAGSGLYVGDLMPTNVSKAIKRTTGMTGRSARGRVYWPGIALQMLAGGANTLDLSVVEVFRDTYQGIDDVVTAYGWLSVVVSRFSGGVKRAMGVTYPVESWTFDNLTTDSMRGRLPST